MVRSLLLNPAIISSYNSSASTFDFGKCVESFFNSQILKRKRLRCVGTIDLVACKDLNTLQSKFRALYNESLKDSNMDNALIVVSTTPNSRSEVDNLSLKAIPLTFLVSANGSEICFQLFAALYANSSGSMKVVLVTRSLDISFLDSDYFRYEYDIPNESNNPFRMDKVPSSPKGNDSKILTFLPDGYWLTGLVLGQSLTQLNTARKNPFLLAKEVYRMNDFVRYGQVEKNILSTSSRWLNDKIINSFFGLVCNRVNSIKSGSSYVALRSEFVTWLLAGDEAHIKHYAPKFDINDQTSNTFVHIPVNYPCNIHWIYILLHVQKHTIYYVDSLSSTSTGEFVAKKLNTFFETEHNLKQSSVVTGSSASKPRRKGFVNWDIKQIQCPKQPDSDSCGIFTIMNMIRTSLKSQKNKYFTTMSDFSPTLENLHKVRQIMYRIMFESASLETLLNYVEKEYF